MKNKQDERELFIDEDDEDTEDYDEFLAELEERYPYKSLKQLLAENEMTHNEAEEELACSDLWFRETVKRIGAPAGSKLAVCTGLCDHMASNPGDADSYELWRICMSRYGDIFFDDSITGEDRLRCSLLLWDDIDDMHSLFARQRIASRRFKEILAAVSAGSGAEDIPTGRVSFADVKRTAEALGFSGKYLEDNLTALTERINFSRELSEIAPLVFYSAFTRYEKKMRNNPDFIMNMKNAFNRESQTVNRDTGKNIKRFYEHINIFLSFADALFTDSDNFLVNAAGFGQMSNITECQLLCWEELTDVLPMERLTMQSGFTCFVRGLDDNPCARANRIPVEDIMIFDCKEGKNEPPAKIRAAMYSFLDSHPEPGERFRRAFINGDMQGCIEAANMVYEGMEINRLSMTGINIGLIQAVITDELMIRTDSLMIDRLAGIADRFEETALKLYVDCPEGDIPEGGDGHD